MKVPKVYWIVIALIFVESFIALINYTDQLLHQGTQVQALIFAPDSQAVYGGGSDSSPKSEHGWVWAWNAKTGRLNWKTRVDEPVHSAMLSPNGASVLTTSPEGSPRLWDTTNGKLRYPLELDAALGTMGESRFTPDGKRVLGCFEDGIQVWDASTGARQAFWGVPQGETGWLDRLQLSKDGSKVLVGITGWHSNLARGSEYTASVQIWNTRDGSTVKHYIGASSIGALSPAGDKVAIISLDYDSFREQTGSGYIKLHAINEGVPTEHSPRFDSDFTPEALEFLPNGNILCKGSSSIGNGVAAYLWDVSKKQLIAQRDIGNWREEVFSPDTRLKAVRNDGEYQVRPPLGTLYDAQTGTKLHDLEGLAGR